MRRVVTKAQDLEVAIGRQVRELRVARRLTQMELAEQANVSVGALKHLEGGAGATLSTFVKAIRALGQEQWLETLAPATAAFNPLEVLEATERARRARRPTRVRHRPGERP